MSASMVIALDYGPITVVRNESFAVVLASADGPEGMPVVVSADKETTDGGMVLLAASAAERAWREHGGMPDDVEAAFETVVRFDPLRLILDATRRGRARGPRLYSRHMSLRGNG